MKAALYGAFVVAQGIDWDDHHDFDDGWWIVMMIGMVLFWALVVVVGVWAVRSFAGSPRPAGGGEGERTAIEVLEWRLAEGSISIEEYEERRRVLLGSPTPEGKEG